MARCVHRRTEVDAFLPQDGERGMVEGKQGLTAYDETDVKIIGIDGEPYYIPIERFAQLYEPIDEEVDAEFWQKVRQRIRALRKSG